MKRVVNLVAVMLVVLLGSWNTVSAEPRTDFALLDQTSGDMDVRCGARSALSKPMPFTYHVAMSNYGADGSVQVTYNDGDFVRYQLKAGESFSFTQAAGGTVGVDDVIIVTGHGGAQLAGSISIITEATALPHPRVSFTHLCVTIPAP